MVYMPAPTPTCRQPRSASQIADLRLAASHMTGPKRRAFEAEMTVKYCGGNPLGAENTFGWGRRTVARGWAERRTGLMWLGAPAAFKGRKRWAEQSPGAAEALRRLAAAQAQHAPTFRTPLASTRLTAHAALEALRAQGSGEEPLPSPRPMAEVRNRMGFRLRKVVTAKPPKKIAQTAAMFANMEKKTKQRQPRTRANACASLAQRRCRAAMCPAAASPGVSTAHVLMPEAGRQSTGPGGWWRQLAVNCPSLLVVPSMLPLLSSPCRHIFSPSCSGDGVPSSRAVWRLWLARS